MRKSEKISLIILSYIAENGVYFINNEQQCNNFRIQFEIAGLLKLFEETLDNLEN